MSSQQHWYYQQQQHWLTHHYSDNGLPVAQSQSQLNADVPAFEPQQQKSGSVAAANVLARLSRVNKHIRFEAQPEQSKAATKKKKERKAFQKALEHIAAPQNAAQQSQGFPARPQKTASHQAESQQQQNHHIRKFKATPRLKVMKEPQPAAYYRHGVQIPTNRLDAPRPVLVVLDLNGTLLHRKDRGTNFTSRPNVLEFLNYLFANHKVMVWSSAKPENVKLMCQKLFTAEQHEMIVAIWARDKLGLPTHAYNMKCQVYKQLSWVWNDTSIQASNPVPDSFWDYTNTVLIDDSVEKAASEPYNLVQIEEFVAREDQMTTDVFGQVIEYLDKLKWHDNVSSYIRSAPFVYQSAMDAVGERTEAVSSEEGGVGLH